MVWKDDYELLIKISEDAYFMARPSQWHVVMEAIVNRGPGVNSHQNTIVLRLVQSR
jgi:hypothetical protein